MEGVDESICVLGMQDAECASQATHHFTINARTAAVAAVLALQQKGMRVILVVENLANGNLRNYPRIQQEQLLLTFQTCGTEAVDVHRLAQEYDCLVACCGGSSWRHWAIQSSFDEHRRIQCHFDEAGRVTVIKPIRPTPMKQPQPPQAPLSWALQPPSLFSQTPPTLPPPAQQQRVLEVPPPPPLESLPPGLSESVPPTMQDAFVLRVRRPRGLERLACVRCSDEKDAPFQTAASLLADLLGSVGGGQMTDGLHEDDHFDSAVCKALVARHEPYQHLIVTISSGRFAGLRALGLGSNITKKTSRQIGFGSDHGFAEAEARPSLFRRLYNVD